MPYLTEIALGIAGLALILCIVLFILLMKTNGRFKKLMKGLGEQDVEKIMQTYASELGELREHVIESSDVRIRLLEKKTSTALRNVAAMGYNAFEHMGNNMSFSVALLDDQKTGLVLTGIYGRDSTYVYMKPIRKGKPEKELSNEEKEVYSRATQTLE